MKNYLARVKILCQYICMKKQIIASGLKQKYIADRLGICQTVLSRYVTGDRKLPAELARPLAKLLGCKASELK